MLTNELPLKIHYWTANTIILQSLLLRCNILRNMASIQAGVLNQHSSRRSNYKITNRTNGENIS